MPKKSTRNKSASKAASRKPALVEKMLRVPWQEYPGHFGGALSKALVDRGNTGSGRIDFRISRYAPNAYVQEHVHKVQEQIYYVLEGNGVLTLDDTEHLMGPHDLVFDRHASSGPCYRAPSGTDCKRPTADGWGFPRYRTFTGREGPCLSAERWKT